MFGSPPFGVGLPKRGAVSDLIELADETQLCEGLAPEVFGFVM